MIRIFKWISKSFRNRTKSVDESFDRYESSYPRVYESRLEDRRVLNAAAVIGVADLGSLRFDAGSQANDGGMDTFELSRISTSQDGKDIAITINDRMVWQGSASQIGAIRFEGSSDVDQFLIDPSIQVGTGIFIDGRQFPLGPHDHLVLAAASDRVFQEIVYHTNEHSVQLRFSESSSQPASTLHVQNVGDIDDRSAALNRHFDFSSTNPAWQLSGSATADGSTVTASKSLHLSNSEMGFRFESPSSNLTFDYRSSTSGESTFVLRDIQLNGLDRFKWLGRDSDTFLTSGEIELGRSLFVQSGSIQMNGSMHGNHSSIVLDATRMLNISSAAEIRDAGGTFTAMSPALSHSGRVDMGAAGVIAMNAGEGVLTMDGLLLSRGDDEHSGGSIFLLGDTVSVLNHSIVDVSGGKGGGQILVGGDERGSNPLIRNATQTSIATQAVLNADARVLGNGGKIVVWANDTAVVDGSGNIRARGGALGGNGGWIETSGKRMLFVKDAANASAVNGLAGTWLLDPRNIEIVDAYPDSLAADTSYFLVGMLIATLNSGTSITIDTSVLPGDYEGNITINAAIIAAPATSTTLTLNANNNITFNAGVTGNAGTSMLSLIASAGNDVDASSVTLSQLQSLTIVASGDVSLSNVTAGGPGQLISVTSGANKSIHLNGDLQTSGASVSLAGGTLLVDGSLARQITTGSDASDGGTVDLSGITSIDGKGSVASLSIDSRGSSSAGNVTLATVVHTGVGINQLSIRTDSLTAGLVTLNNVSLVASSAVASSLTINAGGTLVRISGNTIDLSTNSTSAEGGSASFGNSLIAPTTANQTLTILTGNTIATGMDAGNVTLGGISPEGGNYFDSISIDMSATNPTKVGGTLSFGSVLNPSIAVDGTSGTGITLIGKLTNVASGVVSLLTNPNGAIQDSSAINLTRTVLTSTGGLLLDTSGATNSQLAGDVLVGDIGVNASSRPTSFSVDTRGTTQGSLVLDNSATGAAELHVNGPLDLSKTITKVADDALIRTYGNANSLSLGSTLTSGGAHDLQLSSDGDISVGQINLTGGNLSGGNLTVTIDNNNDLPVASFQSSGTISAGSVSISGNGANDNATINSSLTTTVGSIGFSNLDTVTLNGSLSSMTTILIQNYNDLDINAAVRSEGNVQLTGIGTSEIHMGADIATTGGNVTMSGGTLLVDGTVDRKIATGAGSAATGGSVSLSGIATIDGAGGVASLEIDTRGTSTAGSVSFGNIVASNQGLNQVLIETDSTTAGQVTLGDVRLITKGALAPSLVVRSGGTTILANGTIDLSTSGSGETGGSVDLGASLVAPVNTSSTLTILTSNSHATGGNGGSVTLGGVSANRTDFFDRLSIDTSATNPSANAGVIGFSDVTNPSLAVDGTSGTGITLIGKLTNVASGVVSLLTNPNGAIQDSSAINLTRTVLTSTGGLLLDTSGATNSQLAGDVLVGDIGVNTSSRPTTFSVDTRGTTQGSLVIDNSATGAAELHINGPLDLSKTITKVADDALIRTYGNANSLSLGSTLTSGGAHDLQLGSDGDISVGQINLTGGNLTVTIDNNNDLPVAAFQSSGTISAGSVSISGNGANDNGTIGNTLTTTVGSIAFSDLDMVTLNGRLSAMTTVGTTGTVKDVHLGGGADIVSVESINLTSVTNGLTLTGASGTSSTIQATGIVSNITLGNVTASNARNLTLIANSSISTSQMNLAGGALVATIDSNGDESGATFQSSGTISAGAISISGTGANDNATIGSSLTTTVGSIGFSNLDTVTLNGSLSSKTTVGTSGTSGTVKNLLLSGGADIDAVGSIDLSTVTNSLTLTGASGTSSTIQTTGLASNITLGNVTSSNARNLTLTSNSGISIGQIDLTGGTLVATIDSNGDETGVAFQTNGSISAGSVLIGGTGANDNVTIGKSLTTSIGSVVFSNLDTVTLNGSLVSTTTVGTTGTVKEMLLNAGLSIVAVGTIDLTSLSNGLSLTGASGASNTIQATGLASNIAIGRVTSINARNLTLNSNSSISSGQISLNGGALTVSIDSNGDENGATFQSSGTISTGSVSISGNGANDNVAIGNTLTSSVGSIGFSNLDTVTLNGDVSAKTTFGITGTVNDLLLGSGADIDAVGTIDLTSLTNGLSLVGSNGTTNKLTATGADSNVTPGKVTVTNSVSLTVSSGYNTTIENIDLKGGTLDVAFGQSTSLTDASAQFQKVTAGGLVVTGKSRVNDQVQLNAEVAVGSSGILIQNYNDLDINAAVRSDGNVQLAGIGTSKIHMGANITTKGGNVTMSGGTLLVDGTVGRKIATGAGSAATGGSVSLSGLTSIDGETSIASLEIDTRGTSTAGSVSLGNIVASNQGLNQVLIETDSTTAGQVTLGNVRLVTKDLLAPSLVVQSGDKAIFASGTIDLSTSGSGQTGGAVDLGVSQVAPVNASSTLTIQTGNSSATGGNGGTVTLGGVSAKETAYFDRLSIDTSATNPSASAGVINLANVANPSFTVDGTSGTGITLIGRISNSFSGTLSLFTKPVSIGQDSSAIDLTKADFQTTGGLVFDTSDGNKAKVAGNVLLGDLGVSVQPSSLLVDTRGTTTSGSLILNDGVAGITEMRIAGHLDLTKTTTQLSDDVLLDVNADGSTLDLGNVTSSSAHNLTLTSKSHVSVGQMDLTGGGLSVTVDSNGNETGATFKSSGTISAGSVSISGTGANDNGTIGSSLTTTVGSIDFSNLDTVTLNGSLSSITTVGITGTVKDLRLGGGADIVSVGSINLSTITNGLTLTGVSGTSSAVRATGATSNISLGAVTSGNARNLTLTSNSSISLGKMDLTGGSFVATIDSNGDEVGATFQSNGTISAGSVSISGNGANDNAIIGSSLTTTVGSIGFSNLDRVTLAGRLSSKTTVGTSGTVKDLLLSGGADIVSVDSINLSTVTNGLTLTGESATSSTIQTTGVTSDITLGNVTASNARNLTLTSNSSISIGLTDLTGGALVATIDSNGDETGATFQSGGSISAGSVLISGTGANDNVTIGSSLTTTVGSIGFSNLDTVTLNGSLSSKTTVGITGTVKDLRLSGGADIDAVGSIDLSTGTNGLSLTGASGASSTIRATGMASRITLGNVTSSNARNLTLKSTSSISTSQMNLAGGTLTATIDSNGDQIGATFLSSGTISAGSVFISGNGANDNVTIGNTLTTSVGSIVFLDLDTVTLIGDVSAKTTFGTTGTVNDLRLGSGADIDAVDTIDLTSVTNGLSLAGDNGTTNKITATGATSNVTPGKVTVTNSVSLTVSSGYKATIENIDLKGGTLDVSFGQSTKLTDASAQFQKVTAGGLVVTGKSRMNDQVQLNAEVVVGSNGILIQNYNDLDINAAVRSAGNVQLTGIGTSKNHMGADITTQGGNVTMNGGTLLVDGTVGRKIATGADGATTGGSVSLSGLTSIDGETSIASLEIETYGTSTSGSVSLGKVVASNQGLNRVYIDTSSTTAGQVTLGDIRLISKNGLAPSLVVKSGGSTILANGTINVSTSGSGQTGGTVDLGASQVAPVNASSTLTIQTGNSSATGGDGGTVTLGGVSANGTDYFDRLSIDTSATNPSATAGAIHLANVVNPSFTVDGTSGTGSTSGTGITLIGRILNSFSGTLSLFTKPVSIGQDSSAIDLTKADFQTTGGLVFDTSDGNKAKVAGNVLLGDLGVSVQPSSLLVDTRGTTTSGSLVLNDGVAGITELRIAGHLDLTNTTTQLSDDVLLDVNADGSTLGLGNVTSSSARNLTLTSKSHVSAGQMNLTGGGLSVTVDSNGNETGSTFKSSGTISAGSVSISGIGANDNAIIGSSLTTTVGSIDFSNLDTVTLNASLSSTSTVGITGTVKALRLGGGANIVSVGSIDLSTGTNGLTLTGASGTSSTIQANGATSTITLGNVSSSNARNLTLTSNSNISTGKMDLTGGSFVATIDSNGDEVGATFLSSDSILAGSVSINGNGANDSVTFGSTLTTSIGSVVFSNLDTVTLNGILSSKTTVGTTGTVKDLLLSGGADIDAVGSIDLSTVTDGLTLTGASGTSSTIQATGLSSNITLGAVSSSNARNLTLKSNSNILVGQMNLAGGAIVATIDSNGDEAGAVFQSSGSISAGSVLISGTGANDNVTIGKSLTTSIGSVVFSNLDTVTLNGSLSSATTVGTTSTVKDLHLSGGADIDAVGSINLSTITNGLRLTGGNGTSSTIQATGVASTIMLGNVTSGNARNLTLTSSSNISTGTIVLTGGTLTATIDSNGDESGATFQSGDTISAGSVSISGNGANDNAIIGSSLTTTVGSIVFENLDTVTLNGSLSSKTTVGTTGTVKDLLLGGGADIVSVGSIDLSTGTNGLTLTGASGTSSSIQATGIASTITLGNVTSSNARNLTLTSNSSIATSQMNLAGGALAATIDSNGDETGAKFQSSGTISAGSVSISGTGANDHVIIGSSLTTTVGSIAFSNLDTLTLNGSLSSATTIGTTGTVKEMLLNGGSSIVAVGTIDLNSLSNGLSLTGASGTSNTIQATGLASNIAIGKVTSTNAHNLTLTSNANISSGQIILNGGTLTASIDSNGDESGATFLSSDTISAGSVSISGNGANDNVTFGSTVTTTVGSIGFSNLDTITLNGDVSAKTTFGTTGTVKQLKLGSGVDIDAVGSVDLSTITNGLSLIGASGTSSTIQATGVASNITLGAVSSSNARNLTLTSNSSISTSQMNLAGGALVATIDSNGDETGATFQSSGTISAGSVSISGNGANDNGTFGSGLTTTVGSIGFSNLDTVTLNGSLSSKTTVGTTGTVKDLLLSGGADIVSVGSIDLNSVTNGLSLTGASGTSSTIQATGLTSTITLGDVTSSNARNLTLTSNSTISTGKIDLAGGTLAATVDSNGDESGATFQSSDTISAGSVSISGNGANDSVTLGSTLTSTMGSVVFSNLDTVKLNGSLSSKTTVSTSGTVKDLLLSGGADLVSVGSIDLTSVTNGLTLTGASGTSSSIQATGVASSITLGKVTSSNARNLTLTSNSSISTSQMNLAGGALAATIDSNGDETGAKFQSSGTISAGSVSIIGTGANDNVIIGSSLTTTVGSIAFSNLDTVTLNGSLSSATTVGTTGTVKEMLLNGGSSIVAVGTIDLTSLSKGLSLTGANGASNTIQATGLASNITLGKVTSTNALNLTLTSNSSISSGQIILNGGTLTVTIDSNGDEEGATFLTGGSISAGSVSISGNGANDKITIGSTLTATVGSIGFSNLDTVTLDGDVSAKTKLGTTGTVKQLMLGSGADIDAFDTIDLTSLTNGLSLVGDNGTTNKITATGANSNVTPGKVTITNSVSLTVSSGYKATIEDIDLKGGTLDVSFGQSTSLTDASAQFQKVTAGGLVVTGKSPKNNQVQLKAAVAVGSSGILIQNYNELDLNATVRSVGSVIFVGGGLTVGIDVISTSGAVKITSSGGIAGSGAVAGTVVELNSRLDIGKEFAFNTRTGSLTAESACGQINVSNSFAGTSTVSSLKTVQGGPIKIHQTGGGALNILAIQTGASSLNGLPSNIGVINDSGLIAIDGQVSAGGEGSISLNASGDVILKKNARLETSGKSAVIQGVAGGQFQFISGAIVSAGSSDPTTQAVLSKIPTPVKVSPITDAFGVSVSAEGVATIEIRLGDTNPVIVDQNLAVKVVWAAGEVDDFTTGMLSRTTTNPNIARFDAKGVPVRITHQYLDNPSADPTASIPINVEVGVDAKGRIQLSDSQGIDTSKPQVIPVELRVPTSGLVSLRFDLPQATNASRPLVFDRIFATQSTASTEVAPKLQVIETNSAESSADNDRKYVLRLVTPLDESGQVCESKDVELTLSNIENPNELYRRLPDNRYRIYMIMGSGVALRLQDFYLRNHLPVEIGERIEAETNLEPEQNANEGTSDCNANDSDRAETAIEAGAPVSRFDPALPETSDEDSLDTNGSNVIPSVAAVSGSLLGANSISLRKAARRFRSH